MIWHNDFRARLKLFHPSKVECKSRNPTKKETINEGKYNSAEENENNNRAFDRSDSLIIHDVASDKTINTSSSSINSDVKDVTKVIETTSSTTIQHLLKSIKNETENISKFFVKQEGKFAIY